MHTYTHTPMECMFEWGSTFCHGHFRADLPIMDGPLYLLSHSRPNNICTDKTATLLFSNISNLMMMIWLMVISINWPLVGLCSNPTPSLLTPPQGNCRPTKETGPGGTGAEPSAAFPPFESLFLSKSSFFEAYVSCSSSWMLSPAFNPIYSPSLTIAWKILILSSFPLALCLYYDYVYISSSLYILFI